QKQIAVDALLLDPNNPRFVQDLRVEEHVPDDRLEEVQDEVLRKFGDKGQGGDFFDITDLVDSMRVIGFVPIDRIVVRPLAGSEQYLVVEGNRRIAAVKRLRSRDETETNPRSKLSAEVVASFQEIDAMVLEVEGVPPEELQRRISVILGLRHHGSLLEWDPLPKAFNIYDEYLQLEPVLDEFHLEQARVSEVAVRLSISPSDVKTALRTYIVYLQLAREYTGVKPKHYSLIQAAVSNRYLVPCGYLIMDEVTFRLDEPSLGKMDQLCQFSQRENLQSAQKIIPEPKAFGLLGKLVNKRTTSANQAVRDHAKGLIIQVESGEIEVDAAVDSLTAFERGTRWIESLRKLLEKQANELDIADYSGVGNDRLYKD
ncbi:unnamed protein product, partial [marine sediment metagenome]